MIRRRRHAWWLGAALAITALAWLRDPPWLLHYSSGLGRWEAGPDGAPVRWAAAHASFFVPADTGEVRLRVRAGVDRPADQPTEVTIAIDDVPVERLRLGDDAWRDAAIRMPRRGSRRVRRIDVRCSRSRDDGRAILISQPAGPAGP